MAWQGAGRKRARNPARLELRLRPQDRTGGPPSGRDNGNRRRRDDFAPREVRKRRRSGGRRSALGSMFYWGAVLAVWAIIAAIGLVIWIGAHLPPIRYVGLRCDRPEPVLLHPTGAHNIGQHDRPSDLRQCSESPGPLAGADRQLRTVARSNARPHFSPSQSQAPGLVVLTVTATYNYTPLTPLLGSLVGQMTATVTYRF